MNWPARLIAFYLPQYHPIPENDRWWGKGFTEWTNVTRARPLFPGHHQPQLPADLGFYDLRVPETRAEQAALAREYGIHGFCYYHYWFNGKHLLERPFAEVLASGQPDFPFCLCWANENWTRRWDGAEQEILIGQNYGDDDDRAHIHWLLQAFRDPRYIRIGDKPLMLIYRAHHLPNPRRTLDIWRREARKAGIGDLFMCRVENFANERDDPHALGFDASVDFQPDWKTLADDHPEVVLPNGHIVVDYALQAEAQLQRPAPAHYRFPGVTPGWDNSARRKQKAFIIADSTPEAYGYWLETTIRQTLQRPEEERIVFVNAWNEWAEGNHLEPDQRYGRAYLEATRRALESAREPQEIIPPPLAKPLQFNGFVTGSYYRDWLQARQIGPRDAEHYDRLFAAKPPPLITVLLDAATDDTEALSASLQSIAAQQYRQWHLVVFATRQAPAGLQSSQVDWRVVAPGAWPACIAPCIDGGDGHWFTVLRTGETLAPHALLLAAAKILEFPEAIAVATDGDRGDGNGATPLPMPGIDPLRLASQPNWPGAVIVRREWVMSALADALTIDANLLVPAILLRLLELKTPHRLHHCPIIGLHRPAAWPAPGDAQTRGRLVAAHLARCGSAAAVYPGLTDDSQRIRFEYAGQPPKLAVLLTGTASLPVLQRTIELLLTATGNPPFELRLPLSANTPADLREFLHGLRGLELPNIRIIEISAQTWADGANQLAADADAELLVFLDMACQPLSDHWLDTLARHARHPDIGAVGARFIDRRGALHTVFMRLGLGGSAASPYTGLSANYEGIGGELLIEQGVDAVSGHCLALRRSLFNTLGGFRADRYPDRHADTDLCLRIAASGLTIAWTPFVTLLTSTPATPLPVEPEPTAADEQLATDWLPQISAGRHSNRQLSRSHTTPALEPDLALSWEPLPWRPVPKVYAHPADTAGCGEVRIRIPMKHLRQSGKVQIGGGYRLLQPAEMAAIAPDSIILQRPYTDVALRYLRQLRAHLDSTLIYELDDLITRIPAENLLRSGFPPDMTRRIEEGMRLCDRLIVSTAPLADAYRRYCPDIRIVANRLDGQTWAGLKPAQCPTGRPRVGWAGSGSHSGDLALIEECVRQTAREVDWIFLGLCPSPLASYVKEIHPPVPVNDYPKTLAGLNLDLAVAPLAINAFNEAKSDLKLLEYGILGYPVVCTDIFPYQGNLPVTRVGNQTSRWLEAIRMHLADPAASRRQGEALQKHVRQHGLIEQHIDEWRLAWTGEAEKSATKI